MEKANRNQRERTDRQLNERLDKYSELTRVSAASGAPRSRSGNWGIYAAAVGSALAMGTNASASIIHCSSTNNYCEASSLHPVVTATTAKPDIHIPLLLTSNHQFILDVKTSNGGLSATAQVFTNKVRLFNSTLNHQLALNLASGAPIGASVIAANHAFLGAGGVIKNVGTSGGDPSSFGNFASGIPGFIGIRLSHVGSTAHFAGVTDYGWVRLKYMEVGGLPQSLTLIDWGIDTNADETILAGQTTPEPGTMGLGLLAAGAAGIAALRRRRKADAAA